MKKKNLDFIVLNSMRNEGTTFKTDDNQINIISATENKAFEKKSKNARGKRHHRRGGSTATTQEVVAQTLLIDQYSCSFSSQQQCYCTLKELL